MEYFYTIEVNGVNYKPVDYALNNAPDDAFGVGWTEEISSVTNRASYDLTPALGTDYFARIREGESNYEWVKLVVKESTNSVEKAVRMELVGDHLWRYHYSVPTNKVGDTVYFHFTGLELVPGENGSYTTRTNSWSATEEIAGDMPYTSQTLTEGGYEQALTLDKAATHVRFEFNDNRASYSLSHATYQNFNIWTDAQDGFRGNTQNDVTGISNSGVSDKKTLYNAPIIDWNISPYPRSSLWQEPFDVEDGDENYPLGITQTSHSTPNGWLAERGMFVQGRRTLPQGLGFQMYGRGEGALSLNISESSLPHGVGNVTFSARLAQSYQFGDFATYLNGNSHTNYAISAKLTMSRKFDANDSPDDMSPADPCVSLVGYYRQGKGCYEFRITRTGEKELTATLYRWTPRAGALAAVELASKTLAPSGGNITFSNMLVPKSSSSSDVNNNWTAAIMSICGHEDGGVRITCRLSSDRNAKTIDVDAGNLKNIIDYTDPKESALKCGTYGLGSKDCAAAFADFRYHRMDPATSQTTPVSLALSGSDTYNACTTADGDSWNYELSGRWRRLEAGETTLGTSGLSATIDGVSQTVWLQVAEPGDSNNSWRDTGCGVSVSSYATNTFTMSPCLTATSRVRLQMGGTVDDVTRNDIVVNSVSVEPWRGDDLPYLGSNYEQYDKWAYTKSWIETSAEIEGGSPEIKQVPGTNAFVFVFKDGGSTVSFTPNMDIVLERALIVGGGGSGGATMGGGGGGGGVLEYDWTTNALTLKAGIPVTIKVGAGGAAPVPKYSSGSANATSQPGGNKGGNSSISGLPGVAAITAYGGGGGRGWSQAGQGSASFGSGGGGASNSAGTSYTAAQGNTGAAGFSKSNAYGLGGGGGGAAQAGALGTIEETVTVKTNIVSGVTNIVVTSVTNSVTGGAGGAGKASDITGEILYYGGGGGGGSAWNNNAIGGPGGKIGDGTTEAGRGANRYKTPGNTASGVGTPVAGLDGFGGGGGGGTYVNNSSDANVKAGGGAKGGNGCVILRVRTASKVCTLQPARGEYGMPMGVRSPYLDNGMSLFCFSYANADTNTTLLVQIATNMTDYGSVQGSTDSLDDSIWKTVKRFTFDQNLTNSWTSLLTATNEGKCTTFLSLREHMINGSMQTVKGLMRLIIDPDIVTHALDDATNDVRNVGYGKITITSAYCYDEPPLDSRSWFGWNIHTEGWNTEDKSYAYLNDADDGLSGILNFSADKEENESADAKNIPLGEPDKENEYRQNNPFVQCPAMTNGIGSITFRARLFDTNSAACEVVLYASSDPSAYQVTESDMWKEITRFPVTCPTYQTFGWSTTSDADNFQAVRLEVAGARHGRNGAGALSWEVPGVVPIQRVCLDEISVSEPVAPRITLEAHAFRDHLVAEDICIVTNADEMSQQPLMGESWGVQVTVRPQQMNEDLDTSTNSMHVYLATYKGIDKWGYGQWKDVPTRSCELPRVGTNLVFRSHYSVPASVLDPEDEANTVVQYCVWATFNDSSGVAHTNFLKSSEWKTPYWYWPIDLNEKYGSGLEDRFAAYTILDAISPRRAWFNEVHFNEYATSNEGKYQFVEIALPQGAYIGDWTINLYGWRGGKAQLAQFGLFDAKITSKTSGMRGEDYTNDFTFVALRSPKTKDADLAEGSDGEWESVTVSSAEVKSGMLYDSEPYGFELVRPSGIVEHQIVVQGTNTWTGSSAAKFSGTNMVANLLAMSEEAHGGGNSKWFYAGEDIRGGSLGVFRSHGDDASCWTNRMIATPAKLNKLADGTRQDVPQGYYLRANGTNIWIYATVDGGHVRQLFGTDEEGISAVIIVPKGSSTNLAYKVDAWYQIGSCTTNGENGAAVEVANASGRGSRRDSPPHMFTLSLDDVQETTYVVVKAVADDDLVNAGISVDDPYYPAVMDWLKGFDDANGVHLAKFRTLSGDFVTNLNVKFMYWLDINPTQPDWALVGGMSGEELPGARHAAVEYVLVTNVVKGVEYVASNIRVTVKMMITNETTDVTSELYGSRGARSPQVMRGLEPGSVSSNYVQGSETSWTGATFRIKGALQKPFVMNDFHDLRWFTFHPGSFSNFTSRIEIADPYSSASGSGLRYGWQEYRGIYDIWYRWGLGEGTDVRYSPVEVLKPKSIYGKDSDE